MAALSDDTGIIQHATHDVPNRSTGYCTDDVARAYAVALAALEAEPQSAVAARMATTYLAFLHDAQTADGRFHNFMGFDRAWLDTVGSEDSFGRAMRALGYAMRYAPRASWRSVSKQLFDRAFGALDSLSYPRARAYALVGLADAWEAEGRPEGSRSYAVAMRAQADALKACYMDARDGGWQWFEESLTYDNARLPEAMLRAGLALRDDELVAIGLRTFGFYERTTVEHGIFVPIGNDGWYRRGGPRARYGQQPLEAAALIDAALAAREATGDPAFGAAAQVGLEWFYGRNSAGAVLVRRGGCADGIEASGPSANMGAESTLAYLASSYALQIRPVKVLEVAR